MTIHAVAGYEEEAVATVYLSDVERGVIVAEVEFHEAAADSGLGYVHLAGPEHIHGGAAFGHGGEHHVQAVLVEEAAGDGHVDGRVEQVAERVHQAQVGWLRGTYVNAGSARACVCHV